MSSTSPPPPLPPRKDGPTSPTESFSQLSPPKIPEKDSKYKSRPNSTDRIFTPQLNQHIPLSYTLEDDLSTISISRQFESYLSPLMNESSDLFSLQSSCHQLILRKIESIKPAARQGDTSSEGVVADGEIEEAELFNTDEDKFWLEYLQDINDTIVRTRQVGTLEDHVCNGIPQQLRSVVYLKTLQVRYKVNKDNYASLLKRANSSVTIRNQQAYFENLAVDSNLKDILKIFNYYTSEVISTSNARLEAINSNESTLDAAIDSTSHLPPSNFIVNVSKLIKDHIPNLDNEEILFLLLKFNKMFTVNLIKEEFFYKVNRSLESENSTSAIFLHISKQGINLVLLMKKFLYNFFQEQIKSNVKRLQLLDFVVFEGFDIVIRFIVAVFAQNADTIVSLEGDDLNKYLNDDEKFFEKVNEDPKEPIKFVLSYEPDLIKFENEYHLLHANSLNNNNNELLNLKEINDDLSVKINDIKKQLTNLKETHNEIIEQSSSYKDQLKVATDERDELLKLSDHLKAKYENLSMKDNVRNTRKANEDFSKRSSELESQITQLKDVIEQKKAKILKYQQ